MKKIIVIFLFFLFSLWPQIGRGGRIWLNFGNAIWEGPDNVMINSRIKSLENEVARQLEREKIDVLFRGHYKIIAYRGSWEHRITKEIRSAIGIFLVSGGEEKQLDVIWLFDLWSEQTVKKEAKGVASKIISYLNVEEGKYRVAM